MSTQDLRGQHLAQLGATIARSATTQTQTVTWALTLTAASTTAAATLHSAVPAAMGLLTCLTLWLIHATHLAGERAWRALYADILAGGPLAATPDKLLGPHWNRTGICRAATSWSVAPIHAALSGALLATALIT